jgi:phage gp29-like protein
VIFNELFAVPMLVGKYKPKPVWQKKKCFKNAVFNLGVDAAAVISDNTLIEILETKLAATPAHSPRLRNSATGP